MEIAHTDFKKGKVSLRVTEPEDLWYLSHLIDPGDLVRGKATRKIKIGDGENAKVAKKTYTVTIEAETVDFSSDGSSLRVNGKLKEGPEEIPKDSYQAIALELNSDFTLEKKQWLEYQKQKLKEAAEKKYNYLICLFDREEVLFALTKKFGYEILLTLRGDVPKKRKGVEVKKDFQQEIIKLVENYAERYKPENIILASPAFYKEDLFKKISSPELKKKMVLANCSDVSETSLDEVIKSPELEKTLKSSRIRQEKILLEELLNEINKKGLATYGFNEVKKAIESGAASKLLLTDSFVQKKRADQEYGELDLLLKKMETLKGEIHLLTSEQDSGKRLDGLGGIAAILRYKLGW